MFWGNLSTPLGQFRQSRVARLLVMALNGFSEMSGLVSLIICSYFSGNVLDQHPGVYVRMHRSSCDQSGLMDAAACMSGLLRGETWRGGN